MAYHYNGLRHHRYADGRHRYEDDRHVHANERQVYDIERQVYDDERRAYDIERQVYGDERQAYDIERQVYDDERRAYDIERQVYGDERRAYDIERQVYGDEREAYYDARQTYCDYNHTYDDAYYRRTARHHTYSSHYSYDDERKRQTRGNLENAESHRCDSEIRGRHRENYRDRVRDRELIEDDSTYRSYQRVKGDRHGHVSEHGRGYERGNIHRHVHNSKRENDYISYQRPSVSSRGSSRREEFIPSSTHSQHETTHNINDQYESFIKKENTSDDYRDVRYVKTCRSLDDRKGKRLRRTSPVPYNRNDTKEVRLKSDVARKREYMTKEEPLSDFTDFPRELQHKSGNRSSKSMGSGDLLPIPSQSEKYISSKPRRGLLATPDIESDSHAAVSTGLLATPDIESESHAAVSTGLLATPDIESESHAAVSTGLLATPDIESESHTAVSTGLLATPDIKSESHSAVSTGLLATPDIESESYTAVSTGLLATPDIESESYTAISTGLLPTPVKYEVNSGEYESSDVIPFTAGTYRNPVYQTPKVIADETPSAHIPSGLLPTPTVSPDENLDFRPTCSGLLPTPSCSSLETPVHASTVPADRHDTDVETVVYPSKGLLPTPTGSPSLCFGSHPLMKVDDSNLPINELSHKQTTLNCSENFAALSKHVSETENIPLTESKNHTKNDDEQTKDEAKKMLENIQIQLQLTKTLEGVQKTMQTLQQKIQTDQATYGTKKETTEVKDESDKPRELQDKVVIEVSDDTSYIEVTDNDGEAGNNPLNISSEHDNQCTEKSTEIPENSETQDKNDKDSCEQRNRNNSASEFQYNANTEQFNHCEGQKNNKCANKQVDQREYKTYKEWRLAKERMNKYFYSLSSESEDNVNINRNKEKDNTANVLQNKRNNLSSPNSNLVNKACDENKLDVDKSEEIHSADKLSHLDIIKARERLESKKSLNNRYSPQEVVPAIKQSFKNDYDTNFKVRSDNLDSKSQNERLSSKEEGTGRERRESDRSEDRFSEKLIEKKFESGNTDKSEETDRHKYQKNEHRSRQYSSDSLSSHHSTDRSTHRHNRSRSRDRISGKSHNHNSSRKEKSYKDHEKHNKHSHQEKSHKNHEKSHKSGHHERSHKHYHGEKQTPESKEKHRYHSSCRKESGSSKKGNFHDNFQKDKSDNKGNKSENTLDRSKIESAEQKEEAIQLKNNSEFTGNLFERLAMETHVIDVVGGSSSGEEKGRVKTDKLEAGVKEGTGSQKNDGERKLKNLVVKLHDIVKDTSFSKKDQGIARENIFEKISGKKLSGKNVETPSAISKIKETFPSTSVKTAKTTVLVSEESSCEDDPFVKMSMFLHKEKRKLARTKSESQVLNASVSKKPKFQDDFIVPDDGSEAKSRVTSDSDSDSVTQYSSFKSQRNKKEFVKYLRRVNKTLYWKNVKLLLPRINLRKLSDSDIKRLKSKLKRDNMLSKYKVKEKSEDSDKSAIGGKDMREQVNKIAKIGKRIGDSNNETTDTREKRSLSKEKEKGDSTERASYTKTDEMLHKTRESLAENFESKQTNDDHLNKQKYKRIIPVRSSSAEQSESSDIERVVCVSQRLKQGPVIEESDDSVELEGSLGSEDSTCLDVSDESEGMKSELLSEENVHNKNSSIAEINSDIQFQSDACVVEENPSSRNGDKTDVSVNDASLENNQNNEDKEESEGTESKAFSFKMDIKAKRNIFADITSDCSTQSETEAGTSFGSRQVQSDEGKIIAEGGTSTISKVTANLGKTLKKLKMNSSQKQTTEESSGPEFLCLPERKMFQKFSLNHTSPSESSFASNDNAVEADGFNNSDTVPSEPVQENNTSPENKSSETEKDDEKRMTCSESAGKNISRRNFSDSSTDSSENEKLGENRSATKRRKKQLGKSTEEKRVIQQNSKDTGECIDKNTNPGDSVFNKHLPTRAKRLFKSTTQIKRSSSIMQMDGNADLTLGPPDESSGEEGDIEDNLTLINVDSDDENSASQDLFADLPKKVLQISQMSQKFKQIISSSASFNSIKTENADTCTIDESNHNADNSSAVSVVKENCSETDANGNINAQGTAEPVVKEEPDWLKCYTQEPDTIFLSDDDDEMIMSVSQPVILVSDEDTQDPEADQKPDIEKVKQEKLEPDDKYGSQDTTVEIIFENYSSAEDWSDKGSDFEPENMFNSLQKRTNINTDALGSDQNLSECSLLSDDLFKSQSLLDANNTSNEKGGFESSDGAVMSVNEDELLGSPHSGEAVLSINEDKLLGNSSETKTVEQRSVREADIDKDFSSDDDEILLTSALDIENKYKRTVTAKSKQSVNFKTEEDVVESSQRLKQLPPMTTNDYVTERSPNERPVSTGSDYQEMTPYMQDTQVDPSISDENTSNSITVFDFHSEHFSDISDSDSKRDEETGMVKYKPKTSNKNYGYETLSDDSDIMIIDDPKSEYEVQTQVEKFLHKKGNNFTGDKTQITTVYEEQTQVNDEASELNTSVSENKTDKGVLHDSYFAQTKADKPSSKSVQSLKEKSGSRHFNKQTQAKGMELELYGSQTQVDNPKSDIYSEQTQIDKPGPSALSRDHDGMNDDFEALLNDSFSDEDPQLQSYLQQNPHDNTMRNRRLSQNLGIKFETFSDSVEEEKNTDIYEAFTQVDKLDKERYKQVSKGDTREKTVKVKGKEKRVKIRKDDDITYHSLTRAISSSDILDTDDYGMMTQVDTQSGKQPLSEAAPCALEDTYFRTTLVDFDNIRGQEQEQLNEDKDNYNIATQVDTSSVTKSDENRKEITGTKYISQSNGKSSVDIQQQDSSSDDDNYLAATQVYMEDTSEPENEIADESNDFYNMATQKDVCELSSSDGQIDNQAEEDFDNKKKFCDATEEKDVYNMATQKDIYVMSDSDEEIEKQVENTSNNNASLDVTDEDFYNMATQKDVYKISDSDDDERQNHDSKCSDNENSVELNTSDNDAYFIATQVDTEVINEPEKDHMNTDEDEDLHNMATQKDVYDMSDSAEQIKNRVENDLYNDSATEHVDSRGDEQLDQYNIATQNDVPEMSDSDEAYYMETQADELPDIIQFSTEEEDVSVPAVDTIKPVFPTIYNKIDEDDNRAVHGTRSILKRPYADTTSGRKVTFGVQLEASVPKKLKLSLPERKTLPTEPQKIKTIAEKRASGVSVSFKPQQFFKSQNTANVNADIEIHDASKSDMWLSKNTPLTKVSKWGTKVERARKRKRKEDLGENLQAKMMAAKSQLKERAMYNATHPDSKKRMKTGPTATVTSSELEDVTLPSGSQIIDLGLPLLNTTGILLKRHKSTSHSSTEGHLPPPHGRVTTATVSIATTTISTAISTSAPKCTQSTSVSATPRLHDRISSSEKNHKNTDNVKENNKHKDNSSALNSSRKVTSADIEKGDQASKSIDKDKNRRNSDKDKDRQNKSKSDKESDHSRSHRDKTSHRIGKEKTDKTNREISKNKEDKKSNESRHEGSKENKNRERSDSGSSRKDIEQKDMDKCVDKENVEQLSKTDESKEAHRGGSVGRSDKEKHEKKREDKKHSSDKERHRSGQKMEKDKYAGNKHSERQDNEKNLNKKSSENKQGINRFSGSKNTSSKEIVVSGGTKPDSFSVSTKSAITLTSVPLSSSIGLTTSSLFSSGITYVATTSVNTASVVRISSAVTSGTTSVSSSRAGKGVTSTAVSSSRVGKGVTSTAVSSRVGKGVTSTAVSSSAVGSRVTSTAMISNAAGSHVTSTAVSRSRANNVPLVKTTTSSHVDSSILLQKQGSRPQTTSERSSHLTPSTVTSGRQPFQPLVSNVPGNVELMPSNMLDNAPHLQWNNFLRVILKWSPNWFEERGKMEQSNRRAPPPDVTNDLCGHSNHVLFPLLGKYISFQEYSEKFMLPLLLHETWESCFSTWREKKGKQRLSQHKVMFSHQAQGGDKLFVYTLIGLISERDRRLGNYVNEGDLVKLTINGDLKMDDNNKKNLDYKVSGFIDKVIFKDFSVDRICAHYKEMGEIRKQMRDCISLKLNVRVRARSFIPSDKVIVHLESVSTIINTWRQFTALSCIHRSPLCRDLLYPTANMTYCDRAPAIVPGLQDKYNQSQLTAINTAARIASLPREVPRICLLQGPPGTGKSHTIVGIIKHIIKMTKGQCRICLCAPSHAAVDELLRRLIKFNKTVDKNSLIKMVRLGKKSSVHQEIQTLCLDTLVQKNILQAQKDELMKQLPQSLQGERKSLENKIAAVTRNIETAKDQFQRQKLRADLRKLEKQKEVLESKYVLPRTNVDPQQERKARSNLLLRAHVIAGTLSRMGSNELRFVFQNLSSPGFDVVIVDEATQAIELETLIPLQYGVTKLILVGDPEQLPPTVLSQVATENKFNMSLFERLDGHFKYSNINPVILLDTQYRMDPEIAAFPNNYIYNGKIKNDRCVEKRTQIPLIPYLLFNVTEGRELFSQGTRSMSNPLEARFTAELCQFIVSNTSVIEKVIGIIAPYAKQKLEILRELEKRGLKNIEVSTVDGFQGREKHVIIMSCVRANDSGTVGFVGNRNRMNVSLTRAKYAMYLVGHFESLESSDEWKALIADARQRRKVMQVDQSSMKQAIKKIMKQQERDFTSRN